VIQFRVWRVHAEPVEPGMPGLFQALQLDPGTLERAELGECPFPHRERIPDTEQDQHIPAFSGLEGQSRLQTATGVVAVSAAIRAVPLLDRQGIVVSAVRAEESLATRVECLDLCARYAHPAMSRQIVE
jgi:hypothetical protein